MEARIKELESQLTALQKERDELRAGMEKSGKFIAEQVLKYSAENDALKSKLAQSEKERDELRAKLTAIQMNTAIDRL